MAYGSKSKDEAVVSQDARLIMHGVHTIATILIHILFAQLRPSRHEYFFMKDRSKDPYPILQTVEQFFLEVDWRYLEYVRELMIEEWEASKRGYTIFR